MVKKSITIPENIYEEVKEEGNFSSLVTELLSGHIRQKRINRAKSSFGSREDKMSGVDYVNKMRAEGSRKLPEMD
jgi:predicted CopG family antitoxin